jgi:predicted MFS family arabinose efflux permease
MTYYVSDGFLAVSCIIIIVLLNVKAKKHKQNVFHAFKRIANPASGVFVIIMIVNGIGIGVMSSYVMVYLQEDLGASSSMIGK